MTESRPRPTPRIHTGRSVKRSTTSSAARMTAAAPSLCGASRTRRSDQPPRARPALRRADCRTLSWVDNAVRGSSPISLSRGRRLMDIAAQMQRHPRRAPPHGRPAMSWAGTHLRRWMLTALSAPSPARRRRAARGDRSAANRVLTRRAGILDAGDRQLAPRVSARMPDGNLSAQRGEPSGPWRRWRRTQQTPSAGDP